MSEFVRLKMAQQADRQRAARRNHLLLDGANRSVVDDPELADGSDADNDLVPAGGPRLANVPGAIADPEPEAAPESAEAPATISFDPAASAIQLRALELKKN